MKKNVIFLILALTSFSAFADKLLPRNYTGVTLNDQPCTVEINFVDSGNSEGAEFKYSVSLHDETSGIAMAYLKSTAKINTNNTSEHNTDAVGMLVMARDGQPYAHSSTIENYEITAKENGIATEVMFYSNKGHLYSDGSKSEVMVHCKELQ